MTVFHRIPSYYHDISASGRPVESTRDTTADRDADAVAIERILAGDDAAFATLVEAYSSAMIRLALAFVSSQGVAEEVVQETWLAVLRGLPRFQGRSALKTWIFRILTNRAKTRGVREGRTIPFAALGEADSGNGASQKIELAHRGDWRSPGPKWDDATPERAALSTETYTHIIEAVEQLPDKQRRVVQMRDLEGLTSVDVCNVMNISETYQRVLLHRGRTKVRTALDGYLNGP